MGCYDAVMPGRGEPQAAAAALAAAATAALWAWRSVPCCGGDPQIAVTQDEVAVRSGRDPDAVAVFTRAEWRALAVHVSDREDV